jgi:CDP-4-dehydro-6-deoxyglucose reductase/ferredoxin-NAD(P)+ reductase (naphthalene dioxygenase ferredoxin-specific)
VSYRVSVRQLESPFTVEDGQTILDAAFAAGFDYPCGCQSGNCGACKSALLSGDVELAPYSEFALTDEEKAAGQILACRAMPQSDVELAWLEGDEVAAHPQRRMTCTVEALEPLTHDIRRVALRIQQGGPFTFSPGQYAQLQFDGCPERDFSMANQSDQDTLEFHIRAVVGGAVSQHVLSRLKPGDTVRVFGPRGVSVLREQHRGPIVALAGGSGLAPIQSIVERALTLGLKQPIRLYFGIRDERDLYYEDRFKALAAQHPNFTFTPVLSEPAGTTARRIGFLADVLAADFKTLDGAKAYLAGPPIMVETCIIVLQKLGLKKEHCHADAFFTAADRPGVKAA